MSQPIGNLPEAFCWTKMGDDASQRLDVILRRKNHERLYGDHKVWWGVGENLHRRIQALRDRICPHDPQIVFTPQHSAARLGNKRALVWQDYLIGGRPNRIPEHALVLSSDHTTTYFALICCCADSLTKVVGGELFRNQYQNLVSGKNIGARQVTAVVQRRSPVPQAAGHPYQIHVRASLLEPFFVTLANPRLVEEPELRRADEAGARTFSESEWMDLVRSIRGGGQTGQ